jgi:hypothetical protein
MAKDTKLFTTPVVADTNISPTAVGGITFGEMTQFDENQIPDNAILPLEVAGIENRATTFSKLYSQFARRMTKEAVTDTSVFKYIAWEHVNGIPQNLPKHLVWANGTTYLRGQLDGLVDRFIDYMFNFPAMKIFYNIPNDKSSFTVPDYRDLHILASGGFATFGTQTTSKIVDPISNAVTTVFNKTGLKSTFSGAHTTFQVNASEDIIWESNVQFEYDKPNRNPVPTSMFRFDDKSGVGWYNLSQFTAGSQTELIKVVTPANYPLAFKVNIQNHEHDIVDHNHTASTVINRNTTNIGTRNTVPAISLFMVLDINVNGYTLDPGSAGDPLVEIEDVAGLQDELNNRYLKTEVDALLANKLNITTFNTFTPTVYLKTETYNKTEIDALVATRSFTRFINRTANILVTATPINIFAGLANSNITPTADVVLVNGNALQIPPRFTGKSLITMSLRVTGTVDGSSLTRRSFTASLRRATDNSEISSKLFEKVIGTTFNNEAITVITATTSLTDPFTTNGFYISVSGIDGATATITSYQILFNIIWGE